MQNLTTMTNRVALRCVAAVGVAVTLVVSITAAEAKPRVVDVRPTRAALIACQMGPHFIGAAYRGKRYRPYTRSGRPRICVTEALSAQQIL
jgi:hypothetical protein